MRRAVTLDEANMAALRAYVFEVEEVYTSLRGARPVVERSFRYEVNLLSGAMYWRLLERNGQPLSANDHEAEQARLKRHLELYGGGAQLDETAKSLYNWRRERQYLLEIPEAWQLRLAGTETVNDRACHILDFQPRSPYWPRHRFAHLLGRLRGRVWIDRQDFHWVRLQWETLRRTSYTLQQLPLGRLSLPYSPGVINEADLPAGTTQMFELTRLSGGPWVPVYFRSTKENSFRNEVRYSRFRRFTSESSLIYGEVVK